jgi:mRNA-degrading endonuclease RelE of RelBE toxin-antitoxin system
MAYEIEYDPRVKGHLRALTKTQQQTVRDTTEQRLKHEPTKEDRNRFEMQPNRWATWELRVGALRVYYDVEESLVYVQAIGVKRGDKVFIGGQEVDLHEP